MHHVIIKFFKYLLRSILLIICISLLIGLSKSSRKVSSYVSRLNNINISDLSSGKIISQVLRLDIKKDNKNTKEAPATGAVQDEEIESTGLNVYDPKFEEDMQDASLEAILSGGEEDYGFKTDPKNTTGTVPPQNTNTPSSGDPQKDLLELIKQREMKE